MTPMLQDGIASNNPRRLRQWLLAPIVIITIALGWKANWLGFAVPVAMLMGVAGGFLRGRYVCGNLCPRGSFFDRIITPFAGKRQIPAFLRSFPLRWGVLVLLMGFMVWRIAANPSEINHWGRIFWWMCVITTIFGVLLALRFHPRAWCAVCPVGTLANAIGGDRHQLTIDSDCRECGKCEQSCTFALPIVRHKESGVLRERDCLKCSVCTVNCPRGSLKWPEAA